MILKLRKAQATTCWRMMSIFVLVTKAVTTFPKFRSSARTLQPGKPLCSLGASLLRSKQDRRNSQSLLMRTIRAVFEEKDEILASLEADEIGEKLRGVWSKSGAIVSSYFEQ